MGDASLISTYFPELSEEQVHQFAKLGPLYDEWNSRINVISRKDMDNFYERHVLHSLGIAKVIQFAPGTKLLDIGTGGGFPGIPLAILFPACDFHLIDSIGKKLKVVDAIAEAIGLQNVRTTHIRAEQVKEKYDFIISRAVTAMPDFLRWTQGKVKSEQNNSLPNGILYLKGGDLKEELAEVRRNTRIYPLSDYFKEDFFETKKVVYIR